VTDDISKAIDSLGLGTGMEPPNLCIHHHVVKQLESEQARKAVTLAHQQRAKLETATQAAHAALARLQAERMEFELRTRLMWEAISAEIEEASYTPQHYSVNPKTYEVCAVVFDDDAPANGKASSGFLQ
jgi:hypothetical protein